jgi:hypothetical protein
MHRSTGEAVIVVEPFVTSESGSSSSRVSCAGAGAEMKAS